MSTEWVFSLLKYFISAGQTLFSSSTVRIDINMCFSTFMMANQENSQKLRVRMHDVNQI